MPLDEDKYPAETGRRRFVSGVVGSAALSAVGVGGAAAADSLTSSSGEGGGTTTFVAVENTDGPAPRGMPIIPIEINDGELSGIWPEYDEEAGVAIARDFGGSGIDYSSAWFQYCGIQSSSGIYPQADADNAFLTGGSFGGYMTAWAVGHTDFFDGAVAQRGVFDLTGFYGSTDAYQLIEGDFDAVPWRDAEFLWEHSPAAYAEHVDTPTLVVHADNDYRTPANTAELFYLSLKKQGVDTRMVRYPREGHELSRSGEPGHVVDRIERVARWFDGYSDHHDAERALDRERGDGLSAGEDENGKDGE